MKLSIHVEAVHAVHAEGLSPYEQVAALLTAIGYAPIGERTVAASPVLGMGYEPATATAVPAASVSSVVSGSHPETERPYTPASVMDEPSVQKAVQRERGKPAPGKKRRTAEEVAEDEAAEKTAAETQAIVHDVAAEAKPQISSGEARVGPEDEPEADQIQDIADEHAEVAAAAPAAAPATLDDVRGVVGDYVTAFGMPAVQADGAKILEGVLGPVPADLTDTKGQPTKVWPLAKVPEGRYGDVVAAFRDALTSNPFDRARVS